MLLYHLVTAALLMMMVNFVKAIIACAFSDAVIDAAHAVPLLSRVLLLMLLNTTETAAVISITVDAVAVIVAYLYYYCHH